MWSNTKLLIGTSLLVIIFGFILLWFGLKPVVSPVVSAPIATPVLVAESSPLASSSATLGIQGERVLVSKVVDGDTIHLIDGRVVRFIGMDTPETVDPRRPVGCFGKEASNETKSLLTNKVVILQKDITDKDKYDRILRYIFLPLENGDILFVNDYLVRDGFARVYTYPPDVKFDSQFRQAEQQAREQKKGLWGKCL